MEISYTHALGEKEFVNLNVALQKYRVSTLMTVIKYVSLIVLIFCTLILIMMGEGSKPTTWVFVFCIFFGVLIEINKKVGYRKTYRSSPAIQEEIRYSFSEDCIDATRSSGDARFQWPSITEVLDFKEHLLLMTSKISYIPVPKNKVTPEELEWIKYSALQRMTKKGK